MSTKTTNDPTLQTTKQMLDELDALMDKMLSLPVNDPEESAPFPQEVVKAPTLPPTLAATLTLLEQPSRPARSAPPDASHPALNPPHLELPATIPLAPPPEPLTNEIAPPRRLTNLDPLLAGIPEPESALTTQWGYLPLLWINQAFDGSTLLLGPAGGWLRTQVGRTLLGLSGVALVLLAAAWFLKDWLGWN